MNLLADEGVDRPIVEQLRQDGQSVLYVAEIKSGISDEGTSNNRFLISIGSLSMN